MSTSSQTRNQPQSFHEGLAPALRPAVVAAINDNRQLDADSKTESVESNAIPTTAPAGVSPSLRAAIWIIWAGAIVSGGIGTGLFITDNAQVAVPSPGRPVADAAILARPTATASTQVVVGRMAPGGDVGAVVRAAGITQMAAGNVQAGLSVSQYQRADSAEALVPTYVQYGLVQGTVGTTPVR